jgi:16S rRNA (uracil1498-N3)-methyltransferase
MSRRRFYAQPIDINGSLVSLSTEETHHLVHVLRLKPGDEVFVFDGCGNEYRCSFRAERRSRAELEVIELLSDAVESPVRLTLAQSLAKSDKFDLIVQKATELGVSRIIPLTTEHANVRLSRDQGDRRLDRWRRVSLGALKQCGRRRLVEIAAPMTVSKLTEAEDSGFLLVFSEKGGTSINAALRQAGTLTGLTALIGPEGGWSDAELTFLEGRGATAVSLGPRILRTETAAVVAITLIQHWIGDLSN